MQVFTEHIGILERALGASALRQQALAQNLANVNTPGYKALRVTFEDALASALAAREGRETRLRLVTTDPRHIPAPTPAGPEAVAPVVWRDASHSARADGNNVDLEAEMARVAANQLWYWALSRQIGDEFGRLRLAVTEGRR
ncbi:flagellar basal body rod protein FlgB [Caldinitratiruptor microaerophilus]|uniref:Flagellar basal body rod protein FlgB n=1 Tax=Caldinitratiruptor microaerophilus TaxID=671077 RepID=A0AA35G6T0_9FIRM|nr:flagellar basal body rod protein FlgB [Caldinitratiruptor microaerophilus]BDG59346.1 flagellar basal body rod protein FlgB [Caldinitratiruptor microaerophilus]